MLDIDKSLLPKHIGIIMDGNGRWAKKRGLPRTEGHKQGAEVFRTISSYVTELGIPFVTFYAFSTENWKRPETEVSVIMDIFREFLAEAQDRQEENETSGMKFHFIGDLTVLPEDIQQLIALMESFGQAETKTVVNIAVNYGGRSEITHAFSDLAKKVQSGELHPEEINEDMISASLYTKDQPDPDLIIRPSGEFRLSNFLTWQSAYSEFWFADVLWPDFTKEDLDRAILDYLRRTRRFGGI